MYSTKTDLKIAYKWYMILSIDYTINAYYRNKALKEAIRIKRKIKSYGR